MHFIVGTNGHRPDPGRNLDAGLAAGKGLLGIVRMKQHPLTKHGSFSVKHLPFVGIMLPPGIVMAYGDVKTVAPVSAPCIACLKNIGPTGKSAGC